MTAICPAGGPSSARSGAADDIILTGAVIASILPGGLAWLEPFIGAAVGVITLHLPTFCAVDPPADPGVTGADLLSLATLGPGPLTSAAASRVTQLIERFAWYAFCECTGAATPAPPTPPTVPSGTPQINPPGTVGTTTGPCASFGGSAFSTGAHWYELIDHFEYTGAGFGHLMDHIHPIPTGASRFQIFQRIDTDGTPGAPGANNDYVEVDFWTGTTNRGGSSPSNVLSGPPFSAGGTANSDILPIPAGVDGWTIQSVAQSGVSATFVGSVDFYCSGGINLSGGQQACCTGTDPFTQGTLNAILQMVTLLQRQTAPFAYISGSAHAGLTGTGTVSVQGILGVLLNVSIPGRAGGVTGTPETRFDVGWINFGTADGFEDRRFIQSDSQVVFPSVNGIWTLVGYSLLPGVSMTLTELVREP